MCYHKSLQAKYEKLAEYYSASFSAVTKELESVEARLLELNLRKQQDHPLTKEETSEIKWGEKTIASFGADGFTRYHENGFDYLPTPIMTSGDQNEMKLMRWGLIPFYMSDKEKAFALRTSTLNCISEEMFDKPSFRDAVKNGQRCLIPVTGFFEWRWLDEKGRQKVPYYITPSEQPIASLAGLYSRWKDKATNQYYYSYTVLTTKANELMETIHNSKKRMPVIIAREYEKDWLGDKLTKDDVLAMCQPASSNSLKAHTVSKLITTKDADTNVVDVLKHHAYDEVLFADKGQQESSK